MTRIILLFTVILTSAFTHARPAQPPVKPYLELLSDKEVKEKYSFVVNIAKGFNGFVAEDRRIVVTVAHGFFDPSGHQQATKTELFDPHPWYWKNGNFHIGNATIELVFPECGNRTYYPKHIVFGGKLLPRGGLELLKTQDYAVILLNEPVCESVKPVKIRGINLNNSRYINPEFINLNMGNTQLSIITGLFSQIVKESWSSKKPIREPFGVYRTGGTDLTWDGVDGENPSKSFSIVSSARSTSGMSGSPCLIEALSRDPIAIGLVEGHFEIGGRAICTAFGTDFLNSFYSVVKAMNKRPEDYPIKFLSDEWFDPREPVTFN